MDESLDSGSRSAFRARYQARSAIGVASPGTSPKSRRTVRPSEWLPMLAAFQSPWTKVWGTDPIAATSGEGSSSRGNTAAANVGATSGNWAHPPAITLGTTAGDPIAASDRATAGENIRY